MRTKNASHSNAHPQIRKLDRRLGHGARAEGLCAQSGESMGETGFLLRREGYGQHASNRRPDTCILTIAERAHMHTWNALLHGLGKKMITTADMKRTTTTANLPNSQHMK